MHHRFDRILAETCGHPWMTKFKYKDQYYGGPHSYENDPRVQDFLDWIDPDALTHVLELGSCEGGQTLEILKHPKVFDIICLEGKQWLVERARAVIKAFNYPDNRVRIAQCNLEHGLPQELSNFPVTSIFCSGLLYHLERPTILLRSLQKHSNWLYLATHFTINPNTSLDGYEGRSVFEPKSNAAWAGLANYAFWFTLPSLLKCLIDLGWQPELIRVWMEWSKEDLAPMVGLSCHR